eukprot:7437782-Alexandrium_andersonii.AAC.1
MERATPSPGRRRSDHDWSPASRCVRERGRSEVCPRRERICSSRRQRGARPGEPCSRAASESRTT